VADLILQGYRAYLTDQGLPYDVVLDDKGTLYRMQVKATRGHRAIPQRASFTPGYFFNVRRSGKKGLRRYRNDEFDLLALVALDIRTIAYMTMAELAQSVLLRPPGHVPANNSARSKNIDGFPIERVLSQLRKM
jgi:hypothetical protein